MTELDDFERELLERATKALADAIAEQNLPQQYLSKGIRQAIESGELLIWPSSSIADEATLQVSYLTQEMQDSIESGDIPLSQLFWRYPDLWKDQAAMIAAIDASIGKLKAHYQQHFGRSLEIALAEMSGEAI